MLRTIIIRRDYLHYIPKYSACTAILLFHSISHKHLDRYEKRHKNLAAHASPAFRIDIGDVVTVGTLACRDRPENYCLMICYRPMSTTIKDCAFQRVAGIKEQGCSQGFWKVLRGYR